MSLEDYEIIFNTSVILKEPLSLEVAAVMEFFQEVRRAIPELNDYKRGRIGDNEDSEEEKATFNLVQRGTERNVRQVTLRSGAILLAAAPPLGVAEADQTARIVYPLLSQHLGLNPFLVEMIDVSFRFEFPFVGNHDLFILTKLFGDTPFANLVDNIDGAVTSFQPRMNVALVGDLSTVALVEIQTGTSTREIRSQNYDGDEIRALCGVAKLRGLSTQSLEESYDSLFADAKRFLEQRFVPAIVDRLGQAISSSGAK